MATAAARLAVHDLMHLGRKIPNLRCVSCRSQTFNRALSSTSCLTVWQNLFDSSVSEDDSLSIWTVYVPNAEQVVEIASTAWAAQGVA